MAKFRLQVLTPGTWTVGQNPDGSPRTHTFTREEIKAKAEATAKMLAAGINLPTCFEHQDRVRPGKLTRDQLIEERTKGVNGWTEKLFLDKTTGACFADVEVPHADDAKTVEAIRYCSPEIDQFIDGEQTDHGEVITHLAFTPKPVQHGQAPILRLGHERCMRLAIDPKEGKDMAEETKKDEPPKSDKTDGDKPSELPKDEPKADEAAGGPVDKGLIAALIAAGFTIPKAVASQKELAICIESQAEHLKPDEPDPRDQELEEVSPGMGGVGSAATPMLMSLADKKLIEIERANVVKRLDGLLETGRAKPPEIEKRKKSLTKIQLSLNDKAEVKGHASLMLWLEDRESLEPGSVFPLTNDKNPKRLSHDLQLIEPPPQADELTPERKEELKKHAKELVHGKTKA